MFVPCSLTRSTRRLCPLRVAPYAPHSHPSPQDFPPGSAANSFRRDPPRSATNSFGRDPLHVAPHIHSAGPGTPPSRRPPAHPSFLIATENPKESPSPPANLLNNTIAMAEGRLQCSFPVA